MSEGTSAADVLDRGLLIDGKSVPASSGKRADDVSPWDGEIYARVAAGTPEDITRAADAAQAAFPAWSQLGAFERRDIFLRAADLMAVRHDEALVALARETGASRVFSEFNVALCIQVLREAAAVTRPTGELLPTSIPGAYSMAQRIPVGVVGAISPWNAPLILGIRSIAIPLAVGNTVVMKPSEDAPITCGLLLADVLAEAGLPAGALNVVTNDVADAGDVVAALVADPRVRMVNLSFAAGAAWATWLADFLCLVAGAQAVEANSLSIAALIGAWLAGAGATNLTILPGGLGVVDAAMILTLSASTNSPTAAAATTVLYRLISFAMVAVLGLTAWCGATWRSAGQDRQIDRSVIDNEDC